MPCEKETLLCCEQTSFLSCEEDTSWLGGRETFASENREKGNFTDVRGWAYIVLDSGLRYQGTGIRYQV